MHKFVFNVRLPTLEPPAQGRISQIRPKHLRCVSRTRSAREPWRHCSSCKGFAAPCGCLRVLCGGLTVCPPVIWSAEPVAEWGVMAGGAIIVTQRERANQYNGRFTFFTFVAIMAGATTGLVESQRSHLPPHGACRRKVLNAVMQ